MKKLLAILAVCFVMVSCQWWHETFDSPAECAEWYLDEIYEAASEGDEAKAAELYSDMLEWVVGLDAADAQEADEAALEWMAKHPELDYGW